LISNQMRMVIEQFDMKSGVICTQIADKTIERS